MPSLIDMGRALGLSVETNRANTFKIKDGEGQLIHPDAWLSPYYAGRAIRVHAAKVFKPVYIVAHGWIMYKDACVAAGLDWRECVQVVTAADLRGCKHGRVIIDASFYEAKGPNFNDIERELEKCQINTTL